MPDLPDLKIELSHYPNRRLGWAWSINGHMMGNYPSAIAAVKDALNYLESYRAQRFVR